MKIEDATTADVAAAAETLTAAFAHDALIAYFFRTHPEGVGPASVLFFSLLLRLRIALGMPALALREEGQVLGVAMGYDCERPLWPEPFASEWARLEAETPGLAERMAVYEALGRSHEPAAPHYYLGVLGVHPAAQGQGAGKALLEAFCRRSAADPLSAGVYLDTGNPSSLEFYLRNGFVLRGEDALEGAPLWCVFRSDAGRTRAGRHPEARGATHG
jgi:GNAT superfamily N-acetyltransferase